MKCKNVKAALMDVFPEWEWVVEKDCYSYLVDGCGTLDGMEVTLTVERCEVDFTNDVEKVLFATCGDAKVARLGKDLRLLFQDLRDELRRTVESESNEKEAVRRLIRPQPMIRRDADAPSALA